MEIIEIKPNRTTKKKNQKPTEIVVAKTQAQKGGRRKNKKNKSQNSQRTVEKTGEEYYRDHVMYPDILGPFRQPRFGASARTGLALVRGRVAITGSGTNTVQGISLAGLYPLAGVNTVYNSLTAVNESTGLTIANGAVPSVVFPAASNISDVNLTAASIVVTYLGNPLNVAGQLVIGSSIPLVTGATYNSMYQYPNSTRVPISTLINEPLRAYARKLSERANEFIPVQTLFPDFDYPYILTSGLPTGQVVEVQYTMVYEYRSTTNDANVVPFDSNGISNSRLLESFENAMSGLGNMVSPVVDALPSFIGRMMQGAGQVVSQAALSGASNVGALMTNRYLGRLSNGSYSQRPLLRWRDEL